MPHLTLKQGDTIPDFVAGPEDLAELERELTGNESIRFYMEHKGSGDLIVNQPVTEISESQPSVRYDLGAGETSRLETHYAELVVTYGDGAVESVPDEEYFEVEITEPTARDVPPADLDAPDISVGVVDASEVRAPTLSAVESLTGAITGGKTLSNIAGANLSIDANGDLNAVTGTSDSPSHYNSVYDSNKDGVIDANVNNDVTNTGELSDSFPNGGTVTKTTLVKLTDTDNTTPLSLDTGQLAHYDKLHVEGQVNGFGGGGTGFVTLRHNGKTASNTDYGYSYITAGTVSEATNESGFKEEFPNQYGISVEWDLQASLSAQFTNRGFNISSDTTNYSGNQKILSGQDGTGSALPVESLQISTPFNATAKIGVWGIDY